MVGFVSGQIEGKLGSTAGAVAKANGKGDNRGNPRVQRWQKRSEPLFRWAFEGCHVTLDIPALIDQSGFNIEEMDAGYLAPVPKSEPYCWWGTAVLTTSKGLSSGR
jgi:hypothetical protein